MRAARPLAPLLLALVAGVGCAGKTAQPQIDAAAQTVDAASAERARRCAPELWAEAEAALAEARRLEERGEAELARSKATQAQALFRQAEMASPPGCEAEKAEAETDASGPAGSGGAGVTEAATTLGPEALDEVLDTVYFDFNRAIIRDDSKRVLTEVAEVLRSLPTASIEIEGHCDVRGSTEYNLHLGERRARSVMKYLVTQGVDPDQIRIISYGEERPADFGFTEEAHAANRRAELRRL